MARIEHIVQVHMQDDKHRANAGTIAAPDRETAKYLATLINRDVFHHKGVTYSAEPLYRIRTRGKSYTLDEYDLEDLAEALAEVVPNYGYKPVK